MNERKVDILFQMGKWQENKLRDGLIEWAKANAAILFVVKEKKGPTGYRLIKNVMGSNGFT